MSDEELVDEHGTMRFFTPSSEKSQPITFNTLQETGAGKDFDPSEDSWTVHGDNFSLTKRTERWCDSKEWTRTLVGVTEMVALLEFPDDAFRVPKVGERIRLEDYAIGMDERITELPDFTVVDELPLHGPLGIELQGTGAPKPLQNDSLISARSWNAVADKARELAQFSTSDGTSEASEDEQRPRKTADSAFDFSNPPREKSYSTVYGDNFVLRSTQQENGRFHYEAVLVVPEFWRPTLPILLQDWAAPRQTRVEGWPEFSIVGWGLNLDNSQVGHLIHVSGEKCVLLEGESEHAAGYTTKTFEEELVELRERLIGDATCPDCNGTGEYRGLIKVETCETCGGKGTP